MILKVKVKPRSKKESVKEISETELEVRVSAPPERGKANSRLIEILSKHFGVPKSKIRILKGETSQEKLVEVEL